MRVILPFETRLLTVVFRDGNFSMLHNCAVNIHMILFVSLPEIINESTLFSFNVIRPQAMFDYSYQFRIFTILSRKGEEIPSVNNEIWRKMSFGAKRVDLDNGLLDLNVREIIDCNNNKTIEENNSTKFSANTIGQECSEANIAMIMQTDHLHVKQVI